MNKVFTVFASIIFVFFISACTAPVKAPVASEDAKRYPLTGVVVSSDLEKMKSVIKHERVPDFMEPMTMSFQVYDKDVLKMMTPGSEIKSELIVNGDGEYWLENISVSAADPNAPPINENFAQIGKEVPDFKLTNQDGKSISFNQFRGKALAITFIYSRCPLPEYCILMSRQFSDLTMKLQADAALKDKIRLVSISFDPATDTPETLKKYGLGYMGKDSKFDFVLWQLATAPDKEVRQIADFFGLRYEVDANDKAQFLHSLRTAVIGPDGKVKKVFTGGDWTIDELLDELKKTLPAAS
jgi:protein SCO1/2